MHITLQLKTGIIDTVSCEFIEEVIISLLRAPMCIGGSFINVRIHIVPIIIGIRKINRSGIIGAMIHIKCIDAQTTTCIAKTKTSR